MTSPYGEPNESLFCMYLHKSTYPVRIQAMPLLCSAVRKLWLLCNEFSEGKDPPPLMVSFSGMCRALPGAAYKGALEHPFIDKKSSLSFNAHLSFVVAVKLLLAGKPNSLRCARVLRAGRELLHPSLDDAEPAFGGRLPAHRQKRFAPEGMGSN